MLRRLMCAFTQASEASEKSGRAFVIRAAKSQSSIRVICISSNIVSTRIIFSIKFDRDNRGLLTEASAKEEAAASLANGTKRRSAKELRLRHRADAVAQWPKEGRRALAGVMEDVGC
jgi:hypothetical protein